MSQLLAIKDTSPVLFILDYEKYIRVSCLRAPVVGGVLGARQCMRRAGRQVRTRSAVVHDRRHLAVIQPGLDAAVPASGEYEGDVAFHVRAHRVHGPIVPCTQARQVLGCSCAARSLGLAHAMIDLVTAYRQKGGKLVYQSIYSAVNLTGPLRSCNMIRLRRHESAQHAAVARLRDAAPRPVAGETRVIR